MMDVGVSISRAQLQVLLVRRQPANQITELQRNGERKRDRTQ